MYKLKLHEYMEFLNWDSIYWGIQKDIIGVDIAILYANKLVEGNQNFDSPEIIELLIIDKPEKNIILSLIRKIISNDKMMESTMQRSLRILRFVFLLDVQRKIKNNEELLEKIENIYADFDYPPDMESFISYMPVQDSYDVSKHTEEENKQRLINKFNDFMDNEREWIENK